MSAPSEKREVLVVDDEPEFVALVSAILTELNVRIDTANDGNEALHKIKNGRSYAVCVCDIHMPGLTGLGLLETLKGSGLVIPPFVFVTGSMDHNIITKLNSLGAVEVMGKPVVPEKLISVVRQCMERGTDALSDIMGLVQSVAGIELGANKRSLVETRLLKRTRQLNLPQLKDYLEHFKKNREMEIPHLISAITTHTTEFFREIRHFEFLRDVYFPQRVRSGELIKVWCGAASIGAEIYTIGMCYLDFLVHSKSGQAPTISIYGTDIDHNSIKHASNGVYEESAMRGVSDDTKKRYFDVGRGDLAGYYRVKDSLHSLCRFDVMNLLDFQAYPKDQVDLIFLRNVLIYFSKIDVRRIIARALEMLKPQGVLIVGHSESLVGMDLPIDRIESSIYKKKVASGQLPPSASLPRSNQNLQSRTSVQPPSIKAKSTQVSKESTAPRTLATGKQASALGAKVRVLVVDDSATIRSILRKIFAGDSRIEFVGEAEDTFAAEKFLAANKVDVMTLDIHMPGRDGLSWLESLKGKARPEVIMISSVSYDDAHGALHSIDLGAFDFIEKPAASSVAELGPKICDTVVAAGAKAQKDRTRPRPHVASLPATPLAGHGLPRNALILLGASTGGVEALGVVLGRLPKDCPPVIIVQHIPKAFSAALAQRLDKICAVHVKEAADGDEVSWGTAYIAPGGQQLGITKVGNKQRLILRDDPPVNRHRPSVDYLFLQAAKFVGELPAVAAIMTGMGDDGARGLLALREVGCHTIAQDEASSVVFGMPKVAISLDAAAEVVSLEGIAAALFRSLRQKAAA